MSSSSTGRIDWSDTGLRIEETQLTKEQVDLLLPDDITAWTSAEVAQWIRSLNPTFGPEAAIFDDEGIDGEMLLTLDDSIMKDELNISSTLHRKKILSNIKKKKAEWDMRYGSPRVDAPEEAAEAETPKKPKKEKSSKSAKEKTSRKSKNTTKSSKRKSKSKPKASSKKSRPSASSSRSKSRGRSGKGRGQKLDDAIIEEAKFTAFWKWAGVKSKDMRDVRGIFRYFDRKKKKQIPGKEFRKGMMRFIPSKKDETIRQKLIRVVKETQLEKKWKEFTAQDSNDEDDEEEEEDSEVVESEEELEEEVDAAGPVMQEEYDDFYDTPYFDEAPADPYTLQMDIDRQATIIQAQKNRILELEERVQKQMDLHEMETRQIREKHIESLKLAEAHTEKQLQQLRERHLEEIGSVRDRAKNAKDLKTTNATSPSASVDAMDEQIRINNDLRAQIKDLQRELATAKDFLAESEDGNQLAKVRAQLMTAVDMIAENETILVQVTKERDDILMMCKNLTNMMGGMPAKSSDLKRAEDTLRSIADSPSQTEIRSRAEISAELEKAAVRNEIKPKTKHVRGESIQQFRQRISLLVHRQEMKDGGGSDTGGAESGDYLNDEEMLLDLGSPDEVTAARIMRDD